MPNESRIMHPEHSGPDPDAWPIDREGLRFVAIPAALAALGFILFWPWIWVPALLVTIVMVTFFRNPPRRIPRRPGAVVSPADGTVDSIYVNQDPAAGPVGGTVISIFLSVFNVHVNRAPVEGIIERLSYVPGEFLDARSKDCAARNECNWIFMQSGRHALTVRQIAGKIATRIVCRVQPGQSVARGENIGMIRFGSRTELILPAEARVAVQLGEKVHGGSEIIAWLPE